jgi:quercetin dioxygenase-like cupin family protein
MKTKLSLLACGMIALSPLALAQNAHDYFRGETFPPPRDTPAAWLLELHKADGLLNANIAVAEFLPNTRLAWHNHPGGQVLLITDGVGYYQEKGRPKQIVRAGDVIQCAPGVEHWHGGSLESGLTYVAISPAQKGGTVWGQPVSDEDYGSKAVDRRSRPVFRQGGVPKSAVLVKADAIFPFDVASAGFAQGKSSGWRKQVGGQILVFTDGTGYYQERDKPRRVVRKGDVIVTAPQVEHWQGASTERAASFIAITPRNP